MNDRQHAALVMILNTVEASTPPELTATRRHKPTGLTVMSLLAVDR